MTVKRTLSKTALAITPRPIWNAYLRMRGLPQVRVEREFDGVRTNQDPAPLLSGRFGTIHDRYTTINPFHGPDHYRYRHYNICYFANLCCDIPGDFLIAGVAFGATAKIVYEFVEFETLNKTMHLVDPFDAMESGRHAENYNNDPERVRALFRKGKVQIHKATIPIDLGIKLAFVLCDTGGAIDADIAALPSLYEALNPGGIWISQGYGLDTAKFQPTLDRLGVAPLWLPSGQGVLIKPLTNSAVT